MAALCLPPVEKTVGQLCVDAGAGGFGEALRETAFHHARACGAGELLSRQRLSSCRKGRRGQSRRVRDLVVKHSSTARGLGRAGHQAIHFSRSRLSRVGPPCTKGHEAERQPGLAPTSGQALERIRRALVRKFKHEGEAGVDPVRSCVRPGKRDGKRPVCGPAPRRSATGGAESERKQCRLEWRNGPRAQSPAQAVDGEDAPSGRPEVSLGRRTG
jgi:hypothetical protein